MERSTMDKPNIVGIIILHVESTEKNLAKKP
jgi:hypothetical protein